MADFNFFEAELEAVGGLYIFVEFLFLDMVGGTSMQLTMEDLPTSATPTSAILMFSSARLERERSRSVCIEYAEPLNIVGYNS